MSEPRAVYRVTALKAPFPYPGGKSKVAAEVWRRFGDVPNLTVRFMNRAIAICGVASCALSFALGRPPLGFAFANPCFNSAALKFLTVNIKVICPAEGFQIFNRVVQLIAVNMMNVRAIWNKAMMGFPYYMSAKTPLIRLADLYKSALLSVALVPCSDSYGSNRNRIVSGDKLTIGISFHSSSITSNYVGDKCRY